MHIYYLYIKYCSHCDLRYLGQTIRDPFKYKGSGTRWKKHIKKHNASIHTEVIGIYDTKELLAEAGIFYSKLYNVATDNRWANLVEESGGGFTFLNTLDGYRLKIAEGCRKRSQNPEYIQALKDRWKCPEFRQKMAQANSAKKRGPEYKAKLSEASKKKWQDPEFRAKQIAHNEKRIAARRKQAEQLRGN